MKGFVNSLVYVEDKGVVKTDVAFENGRITAIGDNLGIDERIYVPKNAIVVPGFIDRHVHGGGGSDTMDASVNALKSIADTLKKEGITAFLATTMTQSKDKIKTALFAVNEYIDGLFTDEPELLGVHLEGPFISYNHVGAQPKDYVLKPSVKDFDEFFEASGKNIKVVTLAPEVDDATELISHLDELGVKVSFGHTDATYAEIEALSGENRSVTHLFNAQKGVHHREIGTVGAGLIDDGIYVELICDTVHVSVPALKLAVKTKPRDKIILITDAMRAKGLSDCVSELGGQKVIVKGYEARLIDGTLAGSVLKMNVAIKNMVEKVGVAFCRAVDFATANPAKSLGIFDERGSIAIGKVADFAVLDDSFNVLETIKSGKVIYKA